MRGHSVVGLHGRKREITERGHKRGQRWRKTQLQVQHIVNSHGMRLVASVNVHAGEKERYQEWAMRRFASVLRHRSQHVSAVLT